MSLNEEGGIVTELFSQDNYLVKCQASSNEMTVDGLL